ncbi:ATP-binding protein [Sphingobacterium sp.]|uniref:sensor histidine kinase n=1 Tax=Sphingobacterium sp. TaxID=341027 RepID=UPI0028B091FC|nr:ATP-binding protein [Sphingobacterium sp.]
MGILEGNSLLRNTIDSSLDMIQVFQCVRGTDGKIEDFKWILNNKASESVYGDVIGKSLLKLNPGVLEAGIFDIFREVVRTGLAQTNLHHYVHEQFDGWYHQSVVRQGDGVTTCTKDVTKMVLAQKKIIDLEKDRHREVLHLTLLKVQEERSRLSEVLHNEIGQLLYAASLQLSSLDPEMERKEFVRNRLKLEKLLALTVKEVRELSHDLSHLPLEELGLKGAIEKFLSRFPDRQRFKFRYLGRKSRGNSLQENLTYRIVQELLLNVAKHSCCSHCTLLMRVSQAGIFVQLRDNGRGFDPTSTVPTGIGLSWVRNNVENLGGEILVESHKGKGTVVKLRIPYPTT